MAEAWNRKVVEKLGRRGTIAAGVIASAIFLLAGGPLFLAASGMSVIGIIAFAAILVGPALWVLSDARARGVPRPFLWALVALLGNVLGAVAYVLVRDQQPTQRVCGACGRTVQSDHSACPYCGTMQSPSKRTCARCRNELELDWRFCPYCRTESGSTATAG